VVDELRQVCGLQHFHVLPGVAEDGSQTFLKLVALGGKVDLSEDRCKRGIVQYIASRVHRTESTTNAVRTNGPLPRFRASV
jgi:hypothetical protein